MPNNFNQSSSGWSVEASLYYDTCLAQDEYNQNFVTVRRNRRGDTIAVYYIDYGNVQGPEDIEVFVKGPIEEKQRYLIAQDGEGYHDFEGWSGSDYDGVILNYQDITPFNLEENYDFFKGYDLEFTTSRPLLSVASRGYSQGDYYEVFYCPDDLEKEFGQYPDQSAFKEMFNRYLWDQPIYGVCTVNGADFYYDEFMSDRYEFDAEERTAWINHIHEKTGCPIEILESVIPNEPKYD